MPTLNDVDELGQAVLRELAARSGTDRVSAAITAASLVAQRAAEEIAARDRIIRIARREGAALRSLAAATGLSSQTIANICRQP